jgi:hypothetical protein
LSVATDTILFAVEHPHQVLHCFYISQSLFTDDELGFAGAPI